MLIDRPIKDEYYKFAFHKGGTPSGRLVYWKKGNKVGHGAFGTVWQGLTSTGQLIAVKQIGVVVENETQAKEEHIKLQEEVNMLKNLKHKNIVKSERFRKVYFGPEKMLLINWFLLQIHRNDH